MVSFSVERKPIAATGGRRGAPDGNTLIAVSYLPGTITGEFAVMIIDLR